MTPAARCAIRSIRLAVGVVLALAGCSRAPAPNVLLVTFDTTRYDRFGCTGDPEAMTPTVDALAARGLVFDRAYASVGLTLPSHTTMLTGLEPLIHGVHNNGRFRVPEAVDTLAERLRAAGYQTAAFVSAYVLDARYRLNQGFDTYGDKTHRSGNPLSFMVPQRPGAEVTDEALAWLAGHGNDRPFFLWAHYYDAHQPRDVQPPFDGMPDPYAAEIAYADAQLARLLEGIAGRGTDRDTFIVFTADHGEAFGAHGEATHGLLAYDATLHVPLILAGPRVPAGRRSDAYARHVDIVPTVLEIAGLPAATELPGRSLLNAAAAGPTADDAVIGYFEARGPHYDLGWAELDGVRTARWKYTAEPAPPELYDLIADPLEQVDRAADEPQVRAAMDQLRARLHAQPALQADTGNSHEPDLEEIERLAALGYVEAPVAHQPDDVPDPRRHVRLQSWVDGARSLANHGRYDESIHALETLAQSPSVRPLVLRSLAPIYALRGRYDDAIATYRDYIALTDADEARLGLARTLLRAGRPTDAIAFIDAVARRPTALEILRAHALVRLDRRDEARAAIDAAFAKQMQDPRRIQAQAALIIEGAPAADGAPRLRQLLADAPDDPIVQSWLGYYLAIWEPGADPAEALRLLQAAAQRAPDNADVQANLGWGAYRLGDAAIGIPALEAALAIDDSRQLERFRLALLVRQAGDASRAVALAQAALAARPAEDWAPAARQLIAELQGDAGARPPGAAS